MISIKKITFFILISLLSFTNCNAAIKDSLFATVGNKAITQSDIVNEVKILLILNNQTFSEDKREKIERAAIQSTIKRTIKKIEIDKYNLDFNEEDLNRELERMAASAQTDLDTLKNILEANELKFSNIVDQIQTELMWNSLIFELYKDRLSINMDEINDQLKLIQNKREIMEFLISEIVIKPVEKDKIDTTIKELKNRIENEGFKKVAMEVSISESALKGGDIGWVRENVISRDFKNEIINTPVGNVSRAIFLPEGILFFKVRDKRSSKEYLNIDLESAKNRLVESEKQKILKMHSLTHYDKLKRSISINYY